MTGETELLARRDEIYLCGFAYDLKFMARQAAHGDGSMNMITLGLIFVTFQTLARVRGSF